jgi:hypothetical protein
MALWRSGSSSIELDVLICWFCIYRGL